MALSFDLTESEKLFLGEQARLAIGSRLENVAAAVPMEPDSSMDVLFRDLGAFVTIEIGHDLRGCIGTIIARDPLFMTVWNMARAAAFDDPRFPSLAKREWETCSVTVSVLDKPTLCPDTGMIVIGRDGLILNCKGRSGVFLPQVPVEQGWNVNQYLEHLCLKAGLPSGSWQNPEASLYWYQAMVFHA